MTHSKQQVQTIMLLVLVGLIIAVGSYMSMIKPNLGRAGQYDTQLGQWKKELAEQRRVIKQNLDTMRGAAAMETRIAELETQLRHGLFAGRLTGHFEDLRRAYGFDFRFQHDSEQIEPLLAARYHELSNQFTILACDFYEVVRFIQVLETSNPSTRLGSLEVRTHDPDKPDGLVDAQIELRLIGFKDGRDEPWENTANGAFNPERRNPFSPPGVGGPDPSASLQERLAVMCFHGTIGRAALLKPDPDSAAELVEPGQYLPFIKDKVRLIKFSNRTLLVCHEPTETYYRVMLYTFGNKIGQVETIVEITHE
jgi:hypothetical protein